MKTNTPRTLSLLLGTTILVSLLAACGPRDAGDIAGNTAAVSGRPYFQVFTSANSRYYFRLRATNHEIILSSQGYDTRTAALGGLLSVLDNGGLSPRYELREAKNGQWYFNLKSANGQVIGSSELYTTKYSASRGIRTVIANVAKYLAYQAEATGARFSVKQGADRRFYFNLHAQNGEIVLSSQGYSSEAAALNGTFSVADNGVDAANFDIRPSADGGYYFNLLAENGQVIGTSEVYASKYNAERARDAIVELLPNVDLL